MHGTPGLCTIYPIRLLFFIRSFKKNVFLIVLSTSDLQTCAYTCV